MKRRLQTLGAGMVLFVCLALTPSAAVAEEDMPYMRGGVPQPLPPEDLVAHYGIFLRDNEYAALRQALRGDCRVFRTVFGPEPTRTPLMARFRAEILDRGLCVDFDPVEAARLLEDLLPGDETGDVAAILAWKYHYGHGVPRDPARARDLFLRSILFTYPLYATSEPPASAPQTPAEATLESLLGRPAPPEFLHAMAWMEQQLGTEAGATELGKTLIWGGDLAYADGAPLPRLQNAGVRILRYFRGIEAHYLLGIAGMEGIWSSSVGWQSDLKQAAFCRHVAAATLLATLLHSGRHPDIPRDLDDAEMWRRLAITFGAKEEDLFEPTFLHRMFGLEYVERAWTEAILAGVWCSYT